MPNILSRLLTVAALLGSGAFVLAQTPKPPVGLDLQVQLTAAVKAKKAKVGDAVNAITITPLTLAQGVVVPAGAKVTGHVRQVEADSGEAHTSLIALSFDEIAVKNGQKVVLNSYVRAALLPAVQGLSAQTAQLGQSAPPMQTTRGGMMGAAPGTGVGGTYGTTIGNSGSGTTNSGTTTASGTPDPQGPSKPVTAHTRQVIGMKGVELQITNPDHLSVFRSVHKNLELDEGLELMLVVEKPGI